VLVDANLLLYARNADDPRQTAAATWLEQALNGPTRIGLPWASLTAFARIATSQRVFTRPLTSDMACAQIEAWLAAPAAWVPVPTERHAEIFTDLVRRHRVTGALVADADLAALAIEHGLELASTDADFARFDEIRWVDPLRERATE
jgi:toxin-antitoxin system PIN domain toxin